MRRTICENCDAIFDNVAMKSIETPHPKRANETVSQLQCPECGTCNMFTAICETDGCEDRASGGRMCRQHRSQLPQ